MRDSRIASRYAKALFDFALESGKVEEINNDMNLIYRITSTNKEFSTFLKSPIIKDKRKNIVLRALFQSSIDLISMKFLEIMTSKGRESFLQEISFQFGELYKIHKGIKTAFVQSAVELDKETRDKLIQLLKQQTNSQIELKESVNKDLIGGFVINIGDKQLDTSFRKTLSKLTKEFDVNIFEKGF
jgi:F-type H+-transporting ATPase subunit delta